MNPLPEIAFPGLPEPDPGPIPAAAAALLSARDLGETGFADAPWDRTLLPELIATSERLRGAAEELVVLGDGDAVEGGLALAAAVGGQGGIPVVTRSGRDAPAYLFLVKDPEDTDAWSAYESIRDGLVAASGAGWRGRVAIVTDPARGPFFEEGARTGVALFPYPLAVAGVESILTPAGLLVAACAGGDPAELLDDARAAQVCADEADFPDNPAQRFAAALAAGTGRGGPVSAAPRHLGLARWLDRLLRHHLGDGLADGGGAIHLEPQGTQEDGIVFSGGTTGALVQTLLTGVDLAGRAARGAA